MDHDLNKLLVVYMLRSTEHSPFEAHTNDFLCGLALDGHIHYIR
jgi:hypothetical protein